MAHRNMKPKQYLNSILFTCKGGGGKFNCGSSIIERGTWIQRKQDVSIRQFTEWAMDKIQKAKLQYSKHIKTIAR